MSAQDWSRVPLDVLKNTDTGGYEDLPLPCTNSNTHLALQSGPWPCAPASVFREVQRSGFVSDPRRECILHHSLPSWWLQERWSLLWRLRGSNPSCLYPNTWAQSLSKGVCSACHCGWVRWSREKPWRSVTSRHVPPLQLSAESVGCAVVGWGHKIPRNSAGLLAGDPFRYWEACGIDLPHEPPLPPTAAQSSWQGQVAVCCYVGWQWGLICSGVSLAHSTYPGSELDSWIIMSRFCFCFVSQKCSSVWSRCGCIYSP